VDVRTSAFETAGVPTRLVSVEHRATLTIRVVDKDVWPDLEHLFESRGGPKACWCMVWRATPVEARSADGPSRKKALRRRVLDDVPVGLLAYSDGQPVAWCSVAPRPTYRRLGGLDYGDVPESAVWSIVCFFVSLSVRGTGIFRKLLVAAVDHAHRCGAMVVEAYPVDPDSPSYRFMGFVSNFAEAGFEEVAAAGARRHVMSRRFES
jgi:GNAT superfamily N-acetyltransferase